MYQGAILSGSMSGIFVNYKRVTIKSQTLTAGSNIDHMTASHDDVTRLYHMMLT
jgi:hypothetical protein